ncbi:ABC transporter permease [Methylocapsa sp. S129]|uniref:ABC transporter permease n=1 Tax=Methylocapsa sp. S129 TaxID=1641869 RepID=UPI00131ACA8F|nr:FtsX-like permease family protein [Methylocapsa sp. S129]
MNDIDPTPKASFGFLPPILRLALRDLRGGLAGLRIFLACIALGVATIVGVNSLARSLDDGLSRDGRAILGGDASFSLIHRELSADERGFLSARGALSTVGDMRAMARADDGSAALIEIKSVEASWPDVGQAEFAPAMSPHDAFALKDGVYGAAVEEALLDRLNLKVGDRFALGDARVEIRTTIVSEPDRLGSGLGLGPRALMSEEALRATGLIQPGSLVRWTTRVLMGARGEPPNGAAVKALLADAQKAFPEAGWETRDRANVSPSFSKNLDRFTEFLALIGLTSLIVGGVGVANAAQGFVERKRPTLATLKSIGATGGAVVLLALVEFMGVALIGIGIGMALGAALPFAVDALFGAIIPFPLAPAIVPGELALGLVYGLLTALVFSIAPLGRAHDLPVSALFRDLVESPGKWPRRRYLVATALAALALAALAVFESAEQRIAIIVVIATIIGFIALRLVAMGVMTLARHAPKARGVEWRMALAAIHRPGATTPSVVLSLGLGLAVLVTLTLIDSNLRGQLRQNLPGETPSFYFLDVRGAEIDGFRQFLTAKAPDAKIVEAPMMRGRFVRIGQTLAEDVKAKENVAWVLEGDRGVTYAESPPEGSVITAGQWWPKDYAGPPLVSMEAEIADGLGLKIGDPVTVNVLGRNITATIANLRKVNWRSFAINFVLVYSPNTFNGAPHTFLVTAAFPKDIGTPAEVALLKATAHDFPSIAALRVRDALQAIEALVAKLAVAIRSASGVALSTSVLVLAGALAANRRTRIYDSVVLKILGATRTRLLAAFLIEYVLLGAATAAFGLAAGAGAAYVIVTRVMQLDFTFSWPAALGAALAALLLTVALGMIGAWRILGQKPAAFLREL